MSAPKYQGVQQTDIKNLFCQIRWMIEVIAGNFKGAKGSVATFTPIEIYNARLKKGQN